MCYTGVSDFVSSLVFAESEWGLWAAEVQSFVGCVFLPLDRLVCVVTITATAVLSSPCVEQLINHTVLFWLNVFSQLHHCSSHPPLDLILGM